jgi:hypothetical protein
VSAIANVARTSLEAKFLDLSISHLKERTYGVVNEHILAFVLYSFLAVLPYILIPSFYMLGIYLLVTRRRDIHIREPSDPFAPPHS